MFISYSSYTSEGNQLIHLLDFPQEKEATADAFYPRVLSKHIQYDPHFFLRLLYMSSVSSNFQFTTATRIYAREFDLVFSMDWRCNTR